MWAAARGDEHTIRTLLRCNVDLNTSCVTGNSSLLLAALARRPGAHQALLEAGAKINWKMGWKYTAIHYATCYQNTESYLAPILESETDIDAKDADGSSPLAVAVDYGNAESVASSSPMEPVLRVGIDSA